MFLFLFSFRLDVLVSHDSLNVGHVLALSATARGVHQACQQKCLSCVNRVTIYQIGTVQEA